MRLTLGRALAFALTTLTAPIAAQAHSLSDALVHAYENSNILEQQRFLLRATDENVAIAQSAFRPTINYFGSLTQTGVNGPTDSLRATLGLQMQWTVIDGGSRALRLNAAKEAVLAARYGLLQVEQSVLNDAVAAFVTLRTDLEAVSLRENNLRLITQQLRAAEDRFEVGEVTRTDVAIAQARLAQARSALAAARGQVEVTKELFALRVGRAPHGADALPPAPRLPATEAEAKAIALRKHPSISGLQHQVNANALLVRASEQDRGATGVLNGTLSTSDTNGSGSVNAQLGLTLTQPIYTGGRLAALSRQANATLHASRAQLAQQGRLVSNNVGQAWAMMEIAQAQVAASRQQVRAAQLAFDGVREEATLGARTTLDVLNAEQELLDARTSLLTAQSNAYQSVYGVLNAMGLLTVDHLGLRVERVDITDYYNTVSTAPATTSKYGTRLDTVIRRGFGAD